MPLNTVITELVEEAKRKYPLGSRYIPINPNNGEDYEYDSEVRYLPKVHGRGIEVGFGYVYSYEKKVWAKSLKNLDLERALEIIYTD